MIIMEGHWMERPSCLLLVCKVSVSLDYHNPWSMTLKLNDFQSFFFFKFQSNDEQKLNKYQIWTGSNSLEVACVKGLEWLKVTILWKIEISKKWAFCRIFHQVTSIGYCFYSFQHMFFQLIISSTFPISFSFSLSPCKPLKHL